MIISCKKDDNAQEMWLCIRYVSMEGLLKTDLEGLILTKFCMMNFGCSKSLPQRISVTCNQSAFCCRWRGGWGIGEYSRAKWNEWKIAERNSLAFLDMMLGIQFRASI